MSYDLENTVTIAVLVGLTIVYMYLLLAPNQPRVPTQGKNIVVQPDTRENFEAFIKAVKEYRSGYSFGGEYDDDYAVNASSKHKNSKRYDKQDDFFLDPSETIGGGGYSSEVDEDDEASKPIVPSTKFICKKTWITIRSELNYKYLWMHGNEQMWMGASATIDTPIHRKAFILHPLEDETKCTTNGGWVLLQEGDSDHFIRMISPNRTDSFIHDAWVIRLGTNNLTTALADKAYHFLLEEDGYILNRDVMGFINVLTEQDYPVRGHSSGWHRDDPAHREFGAIMHFQLVNATDVDTSIAKETREIAQAHEDDLQLQKVIHTFTNPKNEKRVISFGLYGSKPKYTTGAIRNAELVTTYFPGWICRFYVTSDVPKEVIDQLVTLHAEIEQIPTGMGYTSGMFWRFMVAVDPTVDRYIIRDSDSRLNARDRMAVEEWIRSGSSIHILRDHVNHCIVMNGGMWGGVKGFLPTMHTKIQEWENRNEYMADLHFLDKHIWPIVKHDQYAHDAYCCDRFPNTHPFPTKRFMTYQHVGQVFNEDEEARLTDIDGFIRGVPIPSSCRKHAEWIYG